MALQIHTPSFFTPKPYHHRRLPHSPFLHFPSKSKLTVKSQTPSEPTNSIDEAVPASPSSKKGSPSGQGFGSSTPNSSPAKENSANPASEKKKQRSKGQRASVVRRSPVEKPVLMREGDAKKIEEQSKNESAFLLTWLGLGILIFVEGILLAASGFLPEEWDKFLVKYLYPSFTPTVFLFVAGTVVYGVTKYLENDKMKEGRK